MKIITFYLPQFHSIPENDEFWGKGFTEWVNVKKAKPLYEKHCQPVVPLNDNYYNLEDIDTMKWQTDIAKKYGVYGFCFYHYWIEGRKLLEKPVENYLSHKEIDFPYCLSWANHSWTDSWKIGSNKTLIAQTYGGREDWINHFQYLLPFFKDSRYIKEDGKPLFIIYMPEDIPDLNEMLDFWQGEAKKNGLKGIKFIYQYIYFDMDKKKDDSRFSYGIEFQPSYAIADSRGKAMATIRKEGYRFLNWVQQKLKIKVKMVSQPKLEVLDYSKIWEYVLKRTPQNSKKIPGAFTGWDNTPRKGNGGLVLDNNTPELFEKYLTLQIKRAKEVYHTDKLFVTAWNEWAEGCVLEPTEKDGFKYLEAVRSALKKNNEWDEN